LGDNFNKRAEIKKQYIPCAKVLLYKGTQIEHDIKTPGILKLVTGR
jgi:hypothetical protein